jgi:hypothetical protein
LVNVRLPHCGTGAKVVWLRKKKLTLTIVKMKKKKTLLRAITVGVTVEVGRWDWAQILA